jgi:hypothetical protein
MSLQPGDGAQPQAENKPAVSRPVESVDGHVTINATSMQATVKSVLGTANEIGGFWNRWGASGSLFILGTFVVIVTFIAHAVKVTLWDDNSFFGALAFALAILILGFVAFADKQNRTGQTEGQAVKVYEITTTASLEGQRIAAQERMEARPKPAPGPQGGAGGTPTTF